MAIFRLNEPVVTDTSTVEVEVSADEPMLPGSYVFQLVVEDDNGNKSPAVQAVVVITDPGPRAVIRVDQERVPFGTPFKLIGDESSDIPPGQIVRYEWTLLQRE